MTEYDAGLIRRFWAKVNKNGPIPTVVPHLGRCWMWTASVNRYGYGNIGSGGKQSVTLYAHRLSYDLARGLPDDPTLVLDHLCRERRCVNPAHLELVTRGENVMRGETLTAAKAAQERCIHGHEFTPENTYRAPGRPSSRACVACRARWRGERQKKALA